MTLLLPRRVLAWVLTILLIAGAWPVMAATQGGPAVQSLVQGVPLPAAPTQALIGESLSGYLEDDLTRKADDPASGGDDLLPVAALFTLAISPAAKSFIAQAITRPSDSAYLSNHKTGPPRT